MVYLGLWNGLSKQESWIVPDGGVTARSDPDTSEVVGVDFVVNKLPTPVLVHIDATCLTMVDFTIHHRRVGPCLHLKPCYPVVVNVTGVKVTLEDNSMSVNTNNKARQI